jgi:hypothetical protein
MTTKRMIARSRLRPITAALAAAASVEGLRDAGRRRDPLRGPTLPLALAAGACAALDAAVPRPLFTYTRGLVPTSKGTVRAPETGLWRVDITNAGDAGANVVDVSYHATPRPGSPIESPATEGCDALDLRPMFDELGVVDERDYLLVRFTSGFGLAAGATVRLLEFPLNVAAAFRRIGVTLTYAGPFGERTVCPVEAIPDHGLPSASWTSYPSV